ncbi:Gfo/Idh/MocA family protein [Rhodococcus sp. ACPA1]|uniref:Gfo/Idh/MocA family protein n=1 Tax=Rhodococcus sp. ACPA1 TaxID=2028572 RepID=UPI000BB11023|nr:Gfo/Idh/MocA family oxidoreductase [Rhodococcus sp. ACPA1]PBC47438.1 hypothetical protein CJ177_41415 [Rhodococcus sp. ACPA1]
MLKGALIGCGYIFPRHVRAWSEVPDAELVALCDLDLKKAQRLASRHGIAHAFASIDELLEKMAGELDFVDVAVPPEAHRMVVEKAVSHGINVLCQKPMAHTLEDSLAITRVTELASLTGAVNEMWKWLPAYAHAGAMIAAGDLGHIERVRFTAECNLLLPRRGEFAFPGVADEDPDVYEELFRRYQPMPRMILLDYGPHILDVLRFWFGEPTALRASVARTHPGVAGDDAVNVTLRYPGFDAEMAIDISRPGPEVRDNLDAEAVAVRGSKGLLTVMAGKWLEWHPTDGERVRISFPQEPRVEAFRNSHQDFVSSLQEGRSPQSSMRDSLRTQSLVFAAYESARRDGTWLSQPSEFASHHPCVE